MNDNVVHAWDDASAPVRTDMLYQLGLDYKYCGIEGSSFEQLGHQQQLAIITTAVKLGLA